MNKVEIAKGVYYVGVVDWTVRDFHGYTTPRGATYNAYLIVDEKIALIDNVKAPFGKELLERIEAIVDPAKIDYIITNHLEPDHAGSLPHVIEKITNATVIINEKAKEGLKKYYGDFNCQIVKEGDTLNLGKNSLHFITLPMLHWPDSMACYLDNEEILFSNDAFGQHIATNKRFDDEVDIDEVMYEAMKYYANILMPFGRLIPGALNKTSKVPIKIIAPSHGVVWRKNVAEIVEKYQYWSQGKNKEKIIVAYETMWGTTESMAKMILEGVTKAGFEAKLYRLSASDRSEIVAELLEAKAIIVGTSTLNTTMLPNVGALLIYLKGLRPTNKHAAMFGSYGWCGGAKKDVDTLLNSAGFNVHDPLSIKWKADQGELIDCYNFGYEFAKSIK